MPRKRNTPEPTVVNDPVLTALRRGIASSSRRQRTEPLGEFIARTYMARALLGRKGAVRALILLDGMVVEVDDLEPLVIHVNGADALL